VVEHGEGGDPSLVRKSPDRTGYEAITPAGAVTHDMEFEHWAKKGWSFGAGLAAKVSPKDLRKTGVIEGYDEAGQVATTATESPARTGFRRMTIPCYRPAKWVTASSTPIDVMRMPLAANVPKTSFGPSERGA
jgi:hypothetical protein